MPELPDVTVYVERIATLVDGSALERVRLASPFVLRTADPPICEVEGRAVLGVRRLGKRIVIGLEGELSLVIHLMIAGRLRWRPKGAAIHRKLGLCAFDFSAGTLLLTEASTKKRASLHLVRGAAGLAAFDRGGLEVLEADLGAFGAALRRENHTLKRALTDPRLLSGIGNAYSDEILHAAQLSPARLTSQLDDAEVARLYDSTREVLALWTDRLRAEVGEGSFPEKVTAFREGMAVHGRYRQPCPRCGAKVQRIVYADTETNYCARCQTGGRLLADRSLSRLLKDDWPRTLDELER
jgi:formamidopyrimidine-DNA glycosylase